jgi:hypothetical protein
MSAKAAGPGPIGPIGPNGPLPADARLLLALQRLAGNRATAGWVAPAIQRLEIYGRAAAPSSALPRATASEFRRLVDAGDQAGALDVLVRAMTDRGELDPRLLRTSGEGSLWEVRDVSPMGAEATFRGSFPDPDDASRRLPNPRFGVSPRMLAPGADLEELHTTLLHEYRHVQQAAERVNGPAVTGPRAPGYGNDPDEFDAYLAEVEQARTREQVESGAIRAGVGWDLLAEPDREPFRTRWTAAQERIRRLAGRDLETILRTDRAVRYRARIEELDRRAREAYERAGRSSGSH